MAQLVTAYDTRTGKARLVPENWFDHESMSANLTREKPDQVEEPAREPDSDQELGQGDLQIQEPGTPGGTEGDTAGDKPADAPPAVQVEEPAQTPATKAGRGKSRTTPETPAAGENQE